MFEINVKSNTQKVFNYVSYIIDFFYQFFINFYQFFVYFKQFMYLI
jgi:hypothetical protein